jgi:hypothetical protein
MLSKILYHYHEANHTLLVITRSALHFIFTMPLIKNKEFWEQLIADFPLIRHEPRRTQRLQQFFYCRVCIRCRGEIYTEPLPSNDRGYTYRQTHERDLGSTLLIRAQLSRHIYQVSGIQKLIGWTPRHTESMVMS